MLWLNAEGRTGHMVSPMTLRGVDGGGVDVRGVSTAWVRRACGNVRRNTFAAGIVHHDHNGNSRTAGTDGAVVLSDEVSRDPSAAW